MGDEVSSAIEEETGSRGSVVVRLWRVPPALALPFPLSFSFPLAALALTALAFALPFEPGRVDPLYGHLELTALEHRVVQEQGILDSLLVSKLDVRKAFALASEFVNEDGNAIDGTAA